MENREGVASIPLAAGRWDFGRFWGVGSLEKRERSLEGKMQTVNSKKKRQKEMPMPISPQMVIFKHVAKGRQGFPRSKGDPRDG